ncbi:restriction endonuclease [Epibacterium sp. DP7N7-1]|nr:restriction endonuclease [Epibacterium sp. DP7N7-1]
MLTTAYFVLIFYLHSEIERTPHAIYLGAMFGVVAAVLTLALAMHQYPGSRHTRVIHNSTPPIDGHAFEIWVATHMRRQGWKVQITQKSADQGIDIIARRSGYSLGIQCKRYTGSVGNKAVQEAYAGRAHYRLDHAAVLTTGRYTRSARKLSKSTKVKLLAVSDIPRIHQII